MHFYKDDEDNDTYDEKQLMNHPLLKKESLFTPTSGKDPFLDAFITAVNTDIINGIKPKTYRNISKDQNKALNDLRNNRDIVIKEADKGSSIVVQDRELYVQECTRQLDNRAHYKKLSKDPTSTFSKAVVKALDKAYQVGLIDSEMNLALRPKNPKPGRFYTLPKVHKPFVTVPTSRPIVGGNGTVTGKISLFLDHYLKPYVPKLRSYVQDDMDFLRKIETVNENGPLPPNVILATMDVSSLYTNIPTQEGIDACRTFLTQEFTNDQLTSFCKLMEIVLTRNNFTFHGDHYVQVFGTSMGTKMAPSMACLFMGSLEDRLLNSYSKKPSLWLRYIDDVFLLWTHGPEEFQNFVHHCNNFHHSIKFTAETSSHEIPFLDVMVSIKDGSLYTDLYSKPTDSHQFLHWTSCHPKHTKSSFPYGLAFRLNRICSTPATLNTRVTELKGFLKARGYPNGTVEKADQQSLSHPSL